MCYAKVPITGAMVLFITMSLESRDSIHTYDLLQTYITPFRGILRPYYQKGNRVKTDYYRVSARSLTE